MKKILLVGSAHPLRGGIATLNERLAVELQKKGYEVEILSFSLQYPDFLFPGTSQYTDDPAPEGIKIKSLLNSINPINWFSVAYQYKKQDFDWIIFRFWMPFLAPCLGTVARILGQNPKSKIIAITDNVLPHEKRLGDHLLIRYFLSACSGFVAMSRSVLEEINFFEPKKPKVYSPHPLYDHYGAKISKTEARKRLNLAENEKYVLFFGLIRQYKGLDLLIEALGQEKIKQQNIKLIVAGEPYENWEKYAQQIADLGLQNSLIAHLRFINADEIANYFCAADLVVQPYKTASQSGVSQVAYHFEVPILVTNVGGLAEIVPHGKVGYAVEPQAEAIAESMRDFFENNRAAEFETNLKEEKKRFEWSKMVETLESLLT